ncbi:uncharacterized protein C8A04DRAFT_39107 [Dichotomopilus funicola]|uniref:RNase T2-like C-terminal domain-containing protein n=1 Tax=Dichotomopilus funicola TaxID=1934379 RepID=A0AAN6UYG5_9PEZI|nr:hypothetical protein C8A04DRAFT_39107 [Dichotomopilus funicola]
MHTYIPYLLLPLTALAAPTINPIPVTPLITTRQLSQSSTAATFTGTGQLRALYISGDHTDLGCLTATGEWTVDEARCGVFVAQDGGFGQFTLRSFGSTDRGQDALGACGIEVATLRCGEGVKGGLFGTFGTQGPIPGRPVLRYSQYGVFATNAADSPPTVDEEPLPIHFYSGSEKGKWVWLGWKQV